MTTVPVLRSSIHDLIAARSGADGQAPALLAPGQPPLTYGALEAWTAGILGRLKATGIGRQDRVALLLPNGPELAASFIAIASGAACAPLNPAYTRAELEFYLDDLRARALVIDAAMDSPARELARERRLPVVEIDSAQRSIPATRWNGDDVGAPHDVALVLHTSGTTARPKLVPLTHANLCASARNVAAALKLDPEDRCLNVMPLFHIHGLVAGVLASLWAGGSVICAPDFQASRFLSWLDELSPTWYTAVPTMHQDVLTRVQHLDKRPVASRLRLIRSSSAPLAPVVMEGLEQAFGVPVIESYGMTEAAHQMTSNPLPPAARKAGTVGVAAGPEVAILDAAGNVLEPGEVGEVAVRGESVFSGYENAPEANDAAFSGDWFRTGDQGALDEDGYLALRGRLKEIINRAGEKISPREVDETLLSHPAVAQAVAFAVPDTRLGEDVGAAVVLHEDASVSERDLREFAAERIADFKVPSVLVFVDEIPKGPSGKLQRIGLAETLGIGPRERGTSPRFEEPRTALERELTNLWTEVLGVERVGVSDDFFALGGDSLLAAELVARLREDYGQPRLPLTTLVWAPTVERLAVELTEGTAARRSQLVVPVQPEGELAPAFFLHGLNGEAVSFAALAQRLGPAQPLFGIRARGVVPGEEPHESFEEMVSDYLAGVRDVQPRGPYYLGGLCMGAPIALEMAKRLQADGEEIAFLGLVDPRPEVEKGWRYYLWQLRLGGRKFRSGDYSWRLVRLYRQREICETVLQSLRRRHVVNDRREPSERAFDERIREIRRSLAPSAYQGDVSVFASVDCPLRQWFWRPLIDGRVDIVEIPSRHVPILRPPAVDVLADHLGRALRAAQAFSGGST